MSTTESRKVNSIIKLNNISKPNSSILSKNVHVNIFTPQSEPSTSKTLFPKTPILTSNKIRSHTIKSIKAESSVPKSTQNAQSSHVIDMITQTDQTEKDRWKDSKLFSKTLSSIDAKSHRNDKKTNQIGSIKSESEPNSANRANSMKGVKGNTKIEHNNFTFQTATLSSPLSSSSSSSSAGQSKKQSEWKTLKSKLSLLRKKDVEFGFEYKDKSASSMMRDENEASGSNIKQKYKNRSNEDEIIRKSGEDGVVWKMQDLMFLIAQSKQMRDKIKEKDLEQKQLELKEQQEKSILTKENSNSSLKKVCSTKKQRNSGPESSEFREDVEEEQQQNVNTNCQQANKCVSKSNSCSGLTGKTECVEKASEFQEIKRESSEKYHLRKNSDKKPTKQISKEEQNKDYNETTKVTEIDTMTSGSEFDDEAKCCVKKHASDSDVIQPDPKPSSSSSSSGLEQVQWDEANYVDPTLIGDAIQAFLKGLNNTPSNSEKRVSFKKMS